MFFNLTIDFKNDLIRSYPKMAETQIPLLYPIKGHLLTNDHPISLALFFNELSSCSFANAT